MDKIQITFKPLEYSDKFTIYLGNTKTNLLLSHSPISTSESYIPNYFTFNYICPYTRSEESLFKLLEWDEFREYYGVAEEAVLDSNGNWVKKSIGTKIGDTIYFKRDEVSKVITSMVDFLIKYHVKENINQIVCFKHYQFPLRDLIEKLQ